MRTIRMLVMLAAVVGLLAATAPAVGQGGATGTPVAVTGEIVPLLNVEPGTLERIDPIVEDGRHVPGVDCVRDQVWRHEAELSDPRLSGTMTTTWNWDDFTAGGDTSVAWGDITIDNEGGSWSGTFTGVEYPTGLMDTHAWLVGSGAYVGLGAFLCLQCASHGPALPFSHDATHSWATSGLLFRGEVPAQAMVAVTSR